MRLRHIHATCLALLVSAVQGFLLDECQAPPRCSCSGPFIRCSNMRLPRLPEFNVTTHYNTLYLHLQHNRILVVPADSFIGLNCNQLYLDLSSNFMGGLHPDAFNGVEDKITFLKLQHNNLQTLPTAVANLSNLILLDIYDNPIKTFDETVLVSLGSHLQMLHVGSPEMDQWPQEFQHLKVLQALRLHDLSLDHLPRRAFRGFESTLNTLEINSTQLTSIPRAICNLTHVNNLIYVNNINSSTNMFLPTCPSPVSSLFSLKLDNNDLKTFPDIFSLFPNLVSLSVSYNRQMAAVDQTIPSGTKLGGLTLTGNNLTEIPPGITNCSYLKTLDLSDNGITKINTTDLEGLNLLFLDISENPLGFIANDAFLGMRSLNHITLDNTLLDNLPEALQFLENIQVVDYNNDEVVCTCESLGWLKNLTTIDTIFFYGECTEGLLGESIDTFVSLILPKC